MSHEPPAWSAAPPPLRHPIARRLDSPRLTLRTYSNDDVEPLARLISENLAHLTPFMPWAASEPLRPIERAALITSWNDEAARGGGIALGCFLGEELIGSTGLHRRRPDPGSLEIGYWLAADHTGFGYATELTFVLAEEAFTHAEITHVDLYCDVANAPSAAVAERAGFTQLAVSLDERGVLSENSSGLERHFRLERGSLDPGWRRRF